MGDTIDVEAVRQYVEAQLLQCQINYMDYNNQDTPEGRALAANEAAVMDKLYEFANLFWGAPTPAPGQGYEPPVAVWSKVTKQRRLELIDTAVAELLRQREAITGPPST